ncbi:hypothetical protein [Microcoleus phage My-WqHQDG]|nr:hypothetical protein [Microcoleus phage My-WqHQDG]
MIRYSYQNDDGDNIGLYDQYTDKLVVITTIASEFEGECWGFSKAWPIQCPFPELIGISQEEWVVDDAGFSTFNTFSVLCGDQHRRSARWFLYSSEGVITVSVTGDKLIVEEAERTSSYAVAECLPEPEEEGEYEENYEEDSYKCTVYPYSTDVPKRLRYVIPQELCLGIETEYCWASDESLSTAIASCEGRAIFKEDGSCGVELVSVPLVPSDMMGFIEGLEIAHLKVNTSCGVHIHLSRKYLTQSQIGGLVVFMNHPTNLPYIEQVAGRLCNKYCKQVPGKVDTVSADRYEMVNLTNSTTVEVRIFAGTNSTETLKGYVRWLLDLLKWLGTCPTSYLATEFIKYQSHRKVQLKAK